MKHLSPEEFVDLMDGARLDSSVRHLDACEACRRQFADLRGMAVAAADDDMAEPSPLFWDHFSARVREAVAVDAARRPSSFDKFIWLRWPQAIRTVGALATIAVAVVVTGSMLIPMGERPFTPSSSPSAPSSAAFESVILPLGAADDPTLSLVADLTADLDMDSAGETGLLVPAHTGGADDVVNTLTDEERRELQRLMQEELAKPHAS